MGGHRSKLFTGTIGDLTIRIPVEIATNCQISSAKFHAISNPVTNSIRSGSACKTDIDHHFPDIVDNYAGFAHEFKLVGGDGITRRLFQLSGSLNGHLGIFEWIVDPDETRGVTHRRFIRGGKINGKPNQKLEGGR